MSLIFIIVLVVIILFIAFTIVHLYNNLVNLRNRVKNSYSQIDVQLKRRNDLSLFAVAESYPDLKANANFQQLQSELSDTEDKISYARQFYNDVVLKYNNACQTFPSNLFAKMFHFEEAEFFEAPASDREVPEVKF